jgi:hypothetical protein
MSEQMSRRTALSLLGLASLSLAVPATMLTTSNAEAQQPAAPTVTPPVAPTGTERRQERRTGRAERRQERREGRTERRQERRTGRTERRQERRGTTPTGQ